MSRLLIATDVDNVCFDYFSPFCEWHNGKYGTSWSPTSVTQYDLTNIFGFSHEALQNRFDEFNIDNLASLPFVDGALSAIGRLAQDHRVIAVSARPLKLHKDTELSCGRFGEGVYSGVYLTAQSIKIHDGTTTKGIICRDLGVNEMVEDSVEQAIEIREKSPGTHVWLFGRYAWNNVSDSDLPDGIERGETWEAVLEGILRRAA